MVCSTTSRRPGSTRSAKTSNSRTGHHPEFQPRAAAAPRAPASASALADREIERSLNPAEAQRTSLVALNDAAAKAEGMLKASCPNDTHLTPPARLKAAGERLETMLQAVKLVHSALDGFYSS
jgi:uncharacterized protein YbjT (DUF2867 family)